MPNGRSVSSGPEMQYRILGRTGLRVSRMGLGGGGHSRLGQGQGLDEQESVRVVKRAIEMGVNLIDTSARNGTEHIIERAIRGYDRDRLVLSTKALVSEGTTLNTPAQFRESIEGSLRALNTPYVDILHLHSPLPSEYEYAVNELLPIIQGFQAAGRARYVGISEHFDKDRDHAMLQRALVDDYFDVVMVGFNIVNQSARDFVFPAAQHRDVGVLGMYVVRKALSSETHFREALKELQSELPPGLARDTIIERLTVDGESRRPLPDVAYRYGRDELGLHSVLVGTGNISHLEQNYATFNAPRLDRDTARFISETFGHISDFSGN